ncbi:MAG: class A beta-lactamase-related serine hydrolase [Gammaproteobacteria bacterium]|nr:class A beta-lactamase-related serine hydrolase [Gammaproteobacteria bacterium]
MDNTLKQVAEREIARIASLSSATIGMCATHTESDEQLSLNAELLFPMASTYKIPIAIQILHSIDEGQMTFDQMVEITQRDISPGSGIIAEYLTAPGLVLSIRNLLEIALRVSDNTASD